MKAYECQLHVDVFCCQIWHVVGHFSGVRLNAQVTNFHYCIMQISKSDSNNAHNLSHRIAHHKKTTNSKIHFTFWFVGIKLIQLFPWLQLSSYETTVNLWWACAQSPLLPSFFWPFHCPLFWRGLKHHIWNTSLCKLHCYVPQSRWNSKSQSKIQHIEAVNRRWCALSLAPETCNVFFLFHNLDITNSIAFW